LRKSKIVGIENLRYKSLENDNKNILTEK